MPGTTIGAGTIFGNTAIVQVLTGSVRVVETGIRIFLFSPFLASNIGCVDGSERQAIKDLDGTNPRSRIKACSIMDPYVLVLREDETLGLYIGEETRGKLRRKDMSAMGDKASHDWVFSHSNVCL
jgi:cleavage and polyadenylation specificity factor subunit 1